MEQARNVLEPQIAALTEEVTKASANALTIESRVAAIESSIRLATAEEELASLDFDNKAL